MRHGRRGMVAIVGLVAALWVLGGAAGAAEGDIQCGSVITEDVVLANDLLDCEDGLIVAAQDVTLDFAGHQIVGRGSAGIGVRVAADGVVVRNGTIRSFSTGVLSAAAPESERGCPAWISAGM